MADQPKMTNAERSKRYRGNKKARIGNEAYRQWERERKRTQRAKLKLDPKKHDAQKKKDRARKYIDKDQPQDIPNQDQNEQAAGSGFTTRQALARSVNKVAAALPKSTPKKMAVLSNVVGRFSPTSRKKLFTNVKSPSGGRPPYSDQQREWIIAFLF